MAAPRTSTSVPISFPNPYRGLRGLPAVVWIVAVTALVNRAGMMALPFLILYLTKHLGLSASVAGLAISVYGLGGLVTAPVAGRLADRVGPFVVMRASLALTGIVLLVIPLASNFVVVLALTFLWAFFAEAARPATMVALTVSAVPEQRKAAVALNRLAVNLGMSIGPAVGGFVAQLSFPLLFVVDGISSLTAAAVLTALLRARHDVLQPPASAVTPQAIADAPAESRPTGAASASAWGSRAALIFFATSFLTNLVFSQHQGAMSLYLVRDLHYRESFYGALFVLNTLIIVAIEVPLNVAMAHWPARWAIALSSLLVAVGFGGLGVATTTIPIAVTVIIWTFGEMIFFPTAIAYMAELAPPGRTGEYMGTFSATIALSLIVGPWLGTFLHDRVGPVATWGTMFAFGVIAAVGFVLSRARGPKVAPAIPE